MCLINLAVLLSRLGLGPALVSGATMHNNVKQCGAFMVSLFKF